MYKLYWHPLTSSYAPHVILEELGVGYELEFLDKDAGANRTPSYLKINPNGSLPTLVLDNGQAMYGSAAIVMFLADRHPQAGLAPAASDPNRHLYNQWLFYMAAELYKLYGKAYFPSRYSTDPLAGPPIRAQATLDIAARWQTLDDALQDRTWLLGDRFSACDIFLQMITLWHIPQAHFDLSGPPLPTDAFFTRFPNVARVAAAVATRPAVVKVMPLYPPEGYAQIRP